MRKVSLQGSPFGPHYAGEVSSPSKVSPEKTSCSLNLPYVAVDSDHGYRTNCEFLSRELLVTGRHLKTVLLPTLAATTPVDGLSDIVENDPAGIFPTCLYFHNMLSFHFLSDSGNCKAVFYRSYGSGSADP